MGQAPKDPVCESGLKSRYCAFDEHDVRLDLLHRRRRLKLWNQFFVQSGLGVLHVYVLRRHFRHGGDPEVNDASRALRKYT